MHPLLVYSTLSLLIAIIGVPTANLSESKNLRLTIHIGVLFNFGLGLYFAMMFLVRPQ